MITMIGSSMILLLSGEDPVQALNTKLGGGEVRGLPGFRIRH